MIFRAGARTAALAVTIALAGCTDGASSPGPVTSSPGNGTTTLSPPATSSGSPSSATPSTATASIALPTLPEAAKKPTAAGAEAFLRYFFSLYDYAFGSLDSDPLMTVSETTCKYCASRIATVERARANQLSYVGGHITVQAVVAAPGIPSEGLLVNASIIQEAGLTMVPDGSIKESFAAVPNRRVEALIRWDGHKWKSAAIVLKNPGE